jgi:hypothetical protein
LNFILGEPPGQTEHCDLSLTVGDCDTDCGQGKRKVTYHYSNQSGYSDCKQVDSEICQSCGLLFRPLPFFEWWQIIPVVALLVVYYVFINRKKLAGR